MAYIVGRSVTDGSSVLAEFAPPIDVRLKACLALSDPSALDQLDAVPRLMRVDASRQRSMPDVIGWSTGPFLVSP